MTYNNDIDIHNVNIFSNNINSPNIFLKLLQDLQ